MVTTSISTTLMIYTSWFHSLLCATQHEAQNAKFYIVFLAGIHSKDQVNRKIALSKDGKQSRWEKMRMQQTYEEDNCKNRGSTCRKEVKEISKSDSLMHRAKTWLQKQKNKRIWHTNLYRAMLPQSTESLRTQKTWGCGFVLMKLYSLRTRICRFYIRY